MGKRLELELIKPASAFSMWTWLGVALLAVGLTLVAFVWRAYQTLQTQHDAVQTQLQALQQSRQNPALTQAVDAPQINVEQLQGLKLAVNELATPWNALFGALEKSSMNDVAILGLQPDSKKQQVVISGEAKNYPTVLAYIDALSKQPMLADVYLQKHAVNDADKDKPVRFSVFARWKISEKALAI